MLEEENRNIRESSTGNSNDAEINRLNLELQQAKANLEKADLAYEEEKKAKEQAIAEKQAAKDMKQIAINVKDSLAQIGVQVNVVTGAGELVLSGYSDECQVVVNVEAGVLYIEKPVKRGIKYKADIAKWNQEDIRTSYMFDDKKVICKSIYEDVSKTTMDIIGRFATLN
jgi:hypothetical protein